MSDVTHHMRLLSNFRSVLLLSLFLGSLPPSSNTSFFLDGVLARDVLRFDNEGGACWYGKSQPSVFRKRGDSKGKRKFDGIGLYVRAHLSKTTTMVCGLALAWYVDDVLPPNGRYHKIPQINFVMLVLEIVLTKYVSQYVDNVWLEDQNTRLSLNGKKNLTRAHY
ncbi:hypothetical protein TNCV_3449131 [Trichonephila clavipes]|nr:hypothetical protein TNCV_3449131 [Trichonephila clavipes]